MPTNLTDASVRFVGRQADAAADSDDDDEDHDDVDFSVNESGG